MKQEIVRFLEQLQNDRRIIAFDEAATKQAIVLRLLSLLQWNTFNIDEVTPEYSLAGKRVDYTLRVKDENKVFIEVKKVGVDLENLNHQEQLLNYAFQQGVKLAVLTNGLTWWFYLPLHEGSWDQRKFYTIDIIQQDADDAASRFVDYLSRANVSSGKAVQVAEAIYKGQRKIKVLKDSLPKAWNKIIEDTDSLLIDLINETAEKICGYKADNEMIEGFFAAHKDHFIISSLPSKGIASGGSQNREKRRKVPPSKPTSAFGVEDFTGKSISSFTFQGETHNVRSFRELLIKFCDLLSGDRPHDFQKTLKLVGRKRPYFTRNGNELRLPQLVTGTDIYVETNLNANLIVRICRDMLAILGYKSDDLKITIQE
jgi:predicted type IV restriction endonuclease